MSDDDLSTGEIARNLAGIRLDIGKLTLSIEQRPDWNDLKDARTNLEDKISAERTIRELQRTVADKAIAALEDTNRWLTRTTLGSLITALVAGVGMVINATKLGAG